MKILLSIVGVIAGAVVGGITVMVLEICSWLVHPLPEGVDWTDAEKMKEILPEHAANAPLAALLIVLTAHLIGPLAGGFLASLIAGKGRLICGLLIGMLFLAAGIVNLFTIPHPLWFGILDVLIYVPAAFLGAKLALKLRPAAA